MVDIGLVGLDTSHGESFAEMITDRDSTAVTAVWDGGDVRSDSHTRDFCDRYGANRYDVPLEMIDVVDAVMILTVDWDTHGNLAVPFLERGVPTMVDKPIAGSLDDVREIESAVGETPFFGGSAIPYHSALDSFPIDRGDGPLYCVGYDDPFYYGTHLVDTLSTMVDEDWASVSPSDDPGLTVDVVFRDGTFATVRFDSPGDERRFSFCNIGNRSALAEVGSGEDDLHDMYRSYVETFVDIVHGELDVAHRVVNAATLLLGAHASIEYDRTVTPDSPELTEYSADPGPFLEEYSPYY